MEKTKYEVHIRYKLCYTYITTTRNCEDMLNQIRQMHEPIDDEVGFKVFRESPGCKKVLIYANKKDRCSKWESELYN